MTLRFLALPIALPIFAMVIVVVASNVLVQYPINDFLTWGAFTFPAAFLVTDLTNRRFGAGRARRVGRPAAAGRLGLRLGRVDALIGSRRRR